MRIATALSVTLLCNMALPAIAGPLSPTGVAHESLRDAAEISGRVVAGVGFSGPPVSRPPLANLFVPANWGGKVICLETVSQDGRYEAQWEYKVEENWPGGYVTAPVKSGYSSYLREQSGKRLASLVRQAACAATDGAISPAVWNVDKPSQGAPTLNLQLNSYRSDEVILILPDGDEIDCEPVKGGYRIAFDFVCELPLASLKAPTATLEILRIKSGRVQPVNRFELVASERRTAKP